MHFEKRDRWMALALMLAALAMRVPLRSEYVYLWDGGEFIEAIRDYNLLLSQPHPPGYPVYVGLGRVVNWMVGDPHASLLAMSLVAGSLTAALLYGLGLMMFGRWAGVAAGILGLTSPPLWFHSEVALTYAVDSAIICAVVWVCWRAVQAGGTWRSAALIGAAWAVASGIRPQNVTMLLPLIAYTLWRLPAPRPGKLLVAAVTAAGVTFCWAVPMIGAAGGWDSYWEVFRRIVAYQSGKTFAGGGWPALLTNVRFVIGYCWSGLGLAAVVVISAVLHRWLTTSKDSEAVCMLGCWVVPMVVMGTCFGYTEVAGHVTSYLPGLLLVAAAAISLARHRTAVLAVVCLWNLVGFLMAPRWMEPISLPLARTAQEIQDHDRQVAVLSALVRQNCSAADTILAHESGHLFYGLRIFQQHLAEFEQVQWLADKAMVRPPGRPLLAVQNGRLTFVAGTGVTNKQNVWLVVPPGEPLAAFAPYADLSQAEAVPGSGGILHRLPATAVREPVR